MHHFETDDQAKIRDTIRRFFTREAKLLEQARAAKEFPRELFVKFAEIGLAGVSIREEFGGIQGGAVTSMVVMEEIAQHDLGCAIFLSVHQMVAGLIQRFGSDDLKRSLLPRMASGELLGAFALTEPGAGSDAAALKSSYVADKSAFRLNAEKCYITSAGAADLYLLFARKEGSTGADGISAFCIQIDRAAPPTQWKVDSPEQKMGAELSPIASLRCADLPLPATALLDAEGTGYKIALSGLAGGRVNIAACANGLSIDALRRALVHVSAREQFAQPLIEFQGLQFMLADMQMKLEAARLLTWQAAAELERNPTQPHNRLYPSMAKCFATDAAMNITTDAVQLLGGAGYIKDYRVEQLMRDAKMLQIVEGTNQIQRIIIAREMHSR